VAAVVSCWLWLLMLGPTSIVTVLLPPLLLLVGAPVATHGFRVLVDLNAFSPAELARVPADFPRADGAWVLTHNTHPPASVAAWRAATDHLTTGGLTVSEDDPMQFTECTAVAKVLGEPPLLAFGYHETGGQPATQLNATEIDLYHAKCRADVAILTRAYWPSSPWRTRVETVLRHPHLGGVVMEYSPDSYGLRSEQAFVEEVLSAGRRAIFLWPLALNNRSLEVNVFDALSSFAQQCGNHTPPTSPCGPRKDPTGHGCACGMDMGSDDVWVVIARYGLPHGAACGTDSACVFGSSNSMAAAVKQALRLQSASAHKTDDGVGVRADSKGVAVVAVDCLPQPRQGAAAVPWNGSILLVGGSSSTGGCKPPYTEYPTVFIGSLAVVTPPSPLAVPQQATTTAPRRTSWEWHVYSLLPSGLTHASAVTVGDMLYVLGGFGPGPCLHSPSKGKCAHSSVWALDLKRPHMPATPRAPMAYNRSNFVSTTTQHNTAQHSMQLLGTTGGGGRCMQAVVAQDYISGCS
jgi:hypothetical protein